MNKILLITSLIFTSYLFANSHNISNAMILAKKENKPIFYIVASSGCPHCHKYISGAVTQNIKKLKKDYILATCDIGKGEHVYPTLPFSGTVPTTYFLLPNAKLATEPIVGEVDKDSLAEMLRQFSDYYANKYQTKRIQK
ncbi:hypothetical protein [Sulfurimonas indica]|uniref:hypothetical protein n=1 Tax=Sulfurimonas TaxID=202746 RepID=UPI0012659FDB|nr:hypothetical protein [Sulfurimonas indica]